MYDTVDWGDHMHRKIVLRGNGQVQLSKREWDRMLFDRLRVVVSQYVYLRLVYTEQMLEEGDGTSAVWAAQTKWVQPVVAAWGVAGALCLVRGIKSALRPPYGWEVDVNDYDCVSVYATVEGFVPSIVIRRRRAEQWGTEYAPILFSQTYAHATHDAPTERFTSLDVAFPHYLDAPTLWRMFTLVDHPDSNVREALLIAADNALRMWIQKIEWPDLDGRTQGSRKLDI